jgi:hypothetical protein
MKKLLIILFMGLLFCNNSFAMSEIYKKNFITVVIPIQKNI